jgi:hypothetical protein
MDILLYDSWCGKPLVWIERHPETGYSAKMLTRSKAIELYGEITNEEFGPRGGWKSVTFGDTKFISHYMKL